MRIEGEEARNSGGRGMGCRTDGKGFMRMARVGREPSV